MRAKIHKHALENGFSLVVTVSLLVILTVVALGLLSLSTLSIRGASINDARTRAEANARMALMIAIGELQKQMGPDQRISANASILSDSSVANAHWMGVWDSWRAGRGTFDRYPDATSSHSTIYNGRRGDPSSDSLHPSYAANREDHFRKWLVSIEESEAMSITAPMDLRLNARSLPSSDDDAILLVADGSLGTDPSLQADYVAARLVDVKDEFDDELRGRYAWWVGDESQKAPIMADLYPYGSELGLADSLYRIQAPGSTGTSTIRGLENIVEGTNLGLLPSLKTLDLVENVTGKPSQINFHDVSPYTLQVLADVREGGLKRDLSTLLERPINLNETGDEFMLYRFGSGAEGRVPIQDLAAYYQLYYNDPEWSEQRRQGVEFNPSTGALEIKMPDRGDPSSRDQHLRQHSYLYSSPVPVRIQYILAMAASPITAQEMEIIRQKESLRRAQTMNPRPTHKLLLGVIPVLTLWNPNNVPMVIEQNNRLIFKMSAPAVGFNWIKYPANGGRIRNAINLGYAMTHTSGAHGVANRGQPYIMQFKLAESNPVRFEPGEVKIFSYPSAASDALGDGGSIRVLNSANVYEPVNEWDPFTFFVCSNSASVPPDHHNWPGFHAFRFPGPDRYEPAYMVFSSGDSFSFQLVAEGALRRGGVTVSRFTEVTGAGLNFWMSDFDHAQSNQTFHFRDFQFLSRFGGLAGLNGGGELGNTMEFNRDLLKLGFPNQLEIIPEEPRTNAIQGSQIISSSGEGEAMAFLSFSLMAGCEIHSGSAGGHAAGRRITSRPFLHGSTLSAPLIHSHDPKYLYDGGWEWQFDKINLVEEAIQMDPGTGNSFYGGGYTIESGTTHVIQQHLPVLPPISIAALSSARLGGFSLANQPVTGDADGDVRFQGSGFTDNPVRNPTAPDAFQKVTATGAVGLAPHTLQAIGNSYAHPNIPADKASTSIMREMSIEESAQEIPYVDHSYLANKALWDEFSFSSLVAQPYDTVALFEEGGSLEDVAADFFAGHRPLLNRRMLPYTNNLAEGELDELISQADQYEGGLADKIAAHLMVQGAFNVNSTSVEAWKVLLTSLKGKPVSHLEEGVLTEHIPEEGVNVNGGTLRNAPPVLTSDINGINDPPAQWQAGRELTDQEIQELAEAIVRQVKLRGPFLSLSEFVNRRLEDGTPLSLKGALQAALDDPQVSINGVFRSGQRNMDTEHSIPFEYPEAAVGPIAYGSSAYVDQADILGHFAEQLAPRGDTFVIRTYGDAVDKNGSVVARAWCEAVVQRVPEYVNPEDDEHLKQADPELSAVSKTYGRKLVITRFRWLNANEI